MAQIETVELFPDLEEKYSQDEKSNQKIKRDAQFDYHGHTVGGAGGRKEKAILHCKESNDLRNCLAAGNHHEKGKEDDGERNADGVAGDGRGHQADGLRQPEGEDNQHQPHQHGGGNVDQQLAVPLRAQALNQAMEAATLSTVLLVSLYRTRASLEAAWKYFILCGVGIAQALFGTILLYFAAEHVLGREGMTALLWTHLNAVKGQLEPRVLGLAFVFLLVGYGTKVGLAPLHNWLPDAHAEGPTPVSAVLSGLLLNVALYAVIRCKVLVEGSIGSYLPGRMLMGFGLLSAVLGAFFLWRQRDIKRLFAYSSIEHMGIITFAFGIGGPIANFAALLHMTVHSLTKSSIFFTAGHASQTAHTQQMDGIRGLAGISPTIGWGLMLGSLAILGMPPFGVFASEFLILTTAMREHPWTTPFLLVALGVAFAAIFRKVQPMVFGESDAPPLPHSPALVPVFIHLAMVLTLGIYMPFALAEWFRAAARLIG